VLLIVLSLLVLFVLVGITFIVVSDQYQRGATRFAQQQMTGDEPSKLLDAAMYEVLRDTRNPRSSLMGHSLLGDLYGPEGFSAALTGYSFELGGQVMRLDYTPLGASARPDDYFNGGVLTLVTGPAAGHSTRIVDYTDGFVWVETFTSDVGGPVLPLAGDRFQVNGRPFNGTGVGFNAGSGQLDLKVTSREVALLPHYIQLPAGTQFNLGGEDESWDAVDYQNMLLARVPPVPDPTFDGDANRTDDIIPSYHRPELLFYWLTRTGGSFLAADVLKQVMLRPSWYDHPNFTGSNPAMTPPNNNPATWNAAAQAALLLAAINGPWDVDNDGDGIPDSIWLDPGFTTKTTPDGRLYKPLVALLCLDLDGRLNINAHGAQAQLTAGYYNPIDTNNVVPGAGATLPLPRGQGYGPADINLVNVFTRTVSPFTNEYSALLAGRYYGGSDTTGVPGHVGDDYLSQLKSIGVPNNYAILPGSYASPPDLHGRGAVVLDHAGQPVTAFMGQSGETTEDPYESNLVSPQGFDSHYTLTELERMLRPLDIDALMLPSRLESFLCLSDDRSKRRLLTTRSFDVPAPNVLAPPQLRVAGNPSMHVLDLYRRRLTLGGVAAVDLAAQLALMVPFEFRHGEKMDVNRLWGNGRDGNGNQVVDEPNPADPTQPAEAAGELIQELVPPTLADYLNGDPSTAHATMPRQVYARHLYCLLKMLLDSGYRLPAAEAGLSSAAQDELTSRRLAQWAINVVDFRDPDAIMSPFEYDANPLNGWQTNIDGDPRTDEGGERRFLWGCEAPELLITETLAFHDRRAKDTNQEGVQATAGTDGLMDAVGEDVAQPQLRRHTDPAKLGDKDPDQYRIPQGSLLLELYCVRNRYTNNPIVPRELYHFDAGTNTAALDLGRLAPAPTGSTVRYPVWRVAITRSHGTSLVVPGPESLLARTTSKPDRTSFDPANLNLLSNLTGEVVDPMDIERIVWFTPNPTGMPGGYVDTARLYVNKTGTFGAQVLLPAGQYAVVGPRPDTRVGARTDAPPNHLSNQRFVMTATAASTLPSSTTALAWYRTDGTQPAAPPMRPVLGIIAGPLYDPSNWDDEGPEGMGLNISEPLTLDPAANGNPAGTPTTKYYPKTNAQVAVGQPFDAYSPRLDVPLDSRAGRPLKDDGVTMTGTYQDYKTALLQRLANPLLPWNPLPGQTGHDTTLQVNPYITVDWQTIDLTVFNGEDRAPAGWDPNLLVGPAPQQAIGAWDPADDPAAAGNPSERFESRQRGEIGAGNVLWSYISRAPDATIAVAGGTDHFAHNSVHTLGYLNEGFGAGLAAPAGYEGAPPQPFPWLTWNNRPYVSHLELMPVPASSAGRLSLEFTTAAPAATNPYDVNAGAIGNARAPYAHLLNFFHNSATANEAANLCRVLDFLEVPSRFVGAERFFNPTNFTAASSASPSRADTFRPPFAGLARFRDPGKVNINTIFDPRIWDAIGGIYTPWENVRLSIQGYSGQALDSTLPTRFANPFRAANSADLTPLPSVTALQKKPAEVTLLRPQLTNAASPLLDFYSTDFYRNSDRNPHFRYQALQRLGNLLTTHSNVYAVWITVGFFEVHPATQQLGAELGSDLGDVKRHRGFYIIDRSIPAAYEPGQNHNVDRAVIVRRFIE